MTHIEVTDLQTHLTVDHQRIADAAARALAAEQIAEGSLSVVVVDNARIRELNARYLGSDRETDVLSFDLADDEEAIAGEVIVSAEKAVEEAAHRGADPLGELLLYVVHGCLHLADYDDATPEQASRMHQRENELMGELGFPGAYGPTS